MIGLRIENQSESFTVKDREQFIKLAPKIQPSAIANHAKEIVVPANAGCTWQGLRMISSFANASCSIESFLKDLESWFISDEEKQRARLATTNITKAALPTYFEKQVWYDLINTAEYFGISPLVKEACSNQLRPNKDPPMVSYLQDEYYQPGISYSKYKALADKVSADGYVKTVRNLKASSSLSCMSSSSLSCMSSSSLSCMSSSSLSVSSSSPLSASNVKRARASNDVCDTSPALVVVPTLSVLNK